MAIVDAHQGAGAPEVEEVLEGGNTGGAVRVGDSVRRPAGTWTPTIQRFLAHLHHQGVTQVPAPLGIDEQGRDSTSYLPGLVPNDPVPAWVWSDEVLTDAARLLARLHTASAGFDTTGASWRVSAHEPAQVICHNDLAPYNMVFTDQTLSALIDWDTASPGPRVWDLAYLAYRLVPLTHPANTDAIATAVPERARRLHLLCGAYGPWVQPGEVPAVAVQRLEDLAAFTAARAEEGHEHLQAHVQLYRRDARWISTHTDQLTGEPR